MKRLLWLLVKGIVTAGLIAVLLVRIDWGEVGVALRQVQGRFLGVALLSYFLITALDVVRLWIVLSPLGLGWMGLWRLQLASAFFGHFLPTQLGPDVYKVAALRSVEGSLSWPMVLIFFLRLLGLLVMVIATAVSTVMLWPAVSAWIEQESVSWRFAGAGPYYLLGLLLGGVGLGLLFFAFRHTFWRHYSRFRKRIIDVLSTLAGIQVTTLVILSCVIVAARVFTIYFLALAVGAHLSMMESLFLIGYVSLAMLLPITIAGLGLREGAIVLCMVLFGALYGHAVLVAFLARAFMLLLALAGGGWLLFDLLAGKRHR